MKNCQKFWKFPTRKNSVSTWTPPPVPNTEYYRAGIFGRVENSITVSTRKYHLPHPPSPITRDFRFFFKQFWKNWHDSLLRDFVIIACNTFPEFGKIHYYKNMSIILEDPVGCNNHFLNFPNVLWSSRPSFVQTVQQHWTLIGTRFFIPDCFFQGEWNTGWDALRKDR